MNTQNISLKEPVSYFGASAFATALGSCILPTPLRASVLVASTSGFTATLMSTCLNQDTSPAKRGALLAASLAALFFGIYVATPPLSPYLSVTIDVPTLTLFYALNTVAAGLAHFILHPPEAPLKTTPPLTYPMTACEVHRLTQNQVHQFFKSFEPNRCSKEVLMAFHLRFYQQCLPFPNDLTCEKIEETKGLSYPD